MTYYLKSRRILSRPQVKSKKVLNHVWLDRVVLAGDQQGGLGKGNNKSVRAIEGEIPWFLFSKDTVYVPGMWCGVCTR